MEERVIVDGKGLIMSAKDDGRYTSECKLIVFRVNSAKKSCSELTDPIY